MNTAATKILLSAFILLVFGASASVAQRQDIHFHWNPSPVIDGDGIVRPEAVNYEVWLKRGDDQIQMIATVDDTTYMLNAEPDVTHRIRVRDWTTRGAAQL